MAPRIQGGSRGALDQDRVTLSLDAQPANAAVARGAIARAGARAGLEEGTIAAAQLVVSEGFSNAVRHAYPGGRGQVEVSARAEDGAITIEVRDDGVGFKPRPRPDGAFGGIGLLLIAALAEELQIRRRPEGGIELRALVTAQLA